MADAIWTILPGRKSDIPESIHYALDLGYLLHRLLWPHGTTFIQICESYTKYVINKYGQAILLYLMDTLTIPPPKTAHQQQSKGVSSARVNFVGDMMLQSKKEEFLSNKHNKQQFINMLGNMLNDQGCKVYLADGDADILISKTAIEVYSSSCHGHWR